MSPNISSSENLKNPAHKSESSSEELLRETSLLTVSKWGSGSKTPMLMFCFYTIALTTAFAHLGLFLYLDGKPADGTNSDAPKQSYVSAASIILGNIFTLSLTGSVTIVFTQYLWYILRTTTLKVSTIESMFAMQANPLLLRDFNAWQKAPILVALVILVWLMNIAASFAPGALIVGPTTRYSYQIVEVPTFDSSFVGNGSGADANKFSLDKFDINDYDTFFPVSTAGSYSQPLQRLAASTMTVGKQSAMHSPCGANCSYTLNLEGPYLQCAGPNFQYGVFNTTSSSWSDNFQSIGQNITFETHDDGTDLLVWNAYQGFLFDPWVGGSEEARATASQMNIIAPSQFSTQTIRPLGMRNPAVRESASDSFGNLVAIEGNYINCSAATATYTVAYVYENNILSTNVSVSSINIIKNLGTTKEMSNVTQEYGISWPGFLVTTANRTEEWLLGLGSSYLGYEPVNWTSDWVSWYKNLQVMAIINSMTRLLNGTYPVELIQFGDATSSLSSAYGLGVDVWGTEVSWVDFLNTFPTSSTSADLLKSTLIGYTPFNDNFGNFNVTAYSWANRPTANLKYDGVSFTLTPELLNQLLQNITLNMISEIGWWSAHSNVTQWESINTFQFSKPLNLILPYFISLFLAIPILVLGIWSLRQNGVSAMNNSFVQILNTTTGSKELERTAGRGCLGGYDNVSDELMDLKIRFGELKDVGRGDERSINGVRRAGFGTEQEIMPLVKSEIYGF
ncbi:uncharacterized protein EAF02_001879 [Botrytis sinoallii]|uniref:uncharacterized protein n=1 Tax=Botrytis sinoallii TaxID=1463999 RepID=UPI001901CDC0|nr:uncharacterized protein EAF02_001879 [Botrytis sinoallii]KAF7891554.1 hypothetical protein EAF02_001879 [Botrytis sinoallii]